MNDEPRIKERACRHCGSRYEFDVDHCSDDEMMFCSPECAGCNYTRQEDFWAAPCSKHQEVADARNEKLLGESATPITSESELNKTT